VCRGRPVTFSLGDILAILRVPQDGTVPDDVLWKGDLPATTVARAADIIERAERLTWMKPSPGTTAKFKRSHVPREFCADYLVQRRGTYKARPLLGLARVPYIDDNGDIDFNPGYNSTTAVFHDRMPQFNVPHIQRAQM
jgi:hypothetical protein